MIDEHYVPVTTMAPWPETYLSCWPRFGTSLHQVMDACNKEILIIVSHGYGLEAMTGMI